jgi:hypothetical protein
VLRRRALAVPITLAVLAAALASAVVVGRKPPPQSVTPRPGANHRGAPDAVTFRADALYGVGLNRLVPNPVAALPQLGNQWRRLEHGVGRALVSPKGTRSHYFEVGMVAFAPRRAARLQMLTSTGQRGIVPINAGSFQVVTFGPLLAPRRGRTGVAFTSVQPRSARPGAELLLSPLQARYLMPGESVTRMSALAELGPGGLRGLYVADGATARFGMTSGILGLCMVKLRAASVGGPLRVTATIGQDSHSAVVSDRPTLIQLGPFAHAGSVLTLRTQAISGRSPRSLFIAALRYVQAGPRSSAR